ncbi:arylamine N-acetyltransferase family protein [Alteraurantiacibacter palmitatis]|uniref:Arylamine N-acetyltransferase n=1 Tax=Alteraurantiacibacter palmitatis TaxID=2054628 RepID=A0ABV7E459_9SPHN
MVADRLAAYLARLGLAHVPPASAAGLAEVQAAHRQAITFENIDVLRGQTPAIDSDSVFAKLVERGRGGYCFEQNRLYADMLAALGIANRPLLARPRLAMPADFIGPRTHVLLLAELGGQKWLADAGFGGSFVPPMPLEDGASAETPDGARHRLRRAGEPHGEWLLERSGPRTTTDGRARDTAEWQAQYSFDLAPVMPMDLEQANHWTATWPQSRFRAGLVVSLVLPAGFAALTDRTLSIGSTAAVEKRELAGAEELRAVLAQNFGLHLSLAEIAQLDLFDL